MRASDVRHPQVCTDSERGTALAPWGSRTSRRAGTRRGAPARRCTRSPRASAHSCATCKPTPKTSSSRLESFEAAKSLPVSDRRVVGLELDARIVEVVVDDLLAERVARDPARREEVARVAQRVGHLRAVGGLVGVALERRL